MTWGECALYMQGGDAIATSDVALGDFHNKGT